MSNCDKGRNDNILQTSSICSVIYGVSNSPVHILPADVRKIQTTFTLSYHLSTDLPNSLQSQIDVGSPAPKALYGNTTTKVLSIGPA